MTWSEPVVSGDTGSDAFKARCSQKHRHNSICLSYKNFFAPLRYTGNAKHELRKPRRLSISYWTQYCQMPAVYQLPSNVQKRGQTSLILDQIAPRPLPQHHLQADTGNIDRCTASSAQLVYTTADLPRCLLLLSLQMNTS